MPAFKSAVVFNQIIRCIVYNIFMALKIIDPQAYSEQKRLGNWEISIKMHSGKSFNLKSDRLKNGQTKELS